MKMDAKGLSVVVKELDHILNEETTPIKEKKNRRYRLQLIFKYIH